ncbi:hypothetical protein [Rhizobium aethiopicum]|uniref:Uncharacterized protein n=1 Tax=Rhizobium aethiopicum TaxID=1138170 RepID=A0A7W6MHJ1_9HYPH|nr:hypothetical protein [Rhizobium aethiopicum]MBB4192835.1 hypothetical protein [Rhizobium aethiopicum]
MTAPHDVMATVRELLDSLGVRPSSFDIGKAIEAAILAERQRCADVTEDIVSYLKETKTMNRSYAVRAAYNAARAILNP